MFWLVREDACFKVPLVGVFCAEACAGEVCGGEEYFFPVDDDGFGVDAGAEDALEEVAFDKGGVAIKVFSKYGAGFFCVDQSDGDAFFE